MAWSEASALLRASAVASSLASLSSQLSVNTALVALFGGGESKTEAIEENAAWLDFDLTLKLSSCVSTGCFGLDGLIVTGKDFGIVEFFEGESLRFSIHLKGGDFGATGDNGNEGR